MNINRKRWLKRSKVMLFVLSLTVIYAGCGPQLGGGLIPNTGNPEPVVVGKQDGSFFYFSYDDSSSTAAKDLSLHALDNNQLPSASWARPYEFLNAEQFGHFNAQSVGPFQVSMGLLETDSSEIPLIDAETNQTLYTLGVTVSGPAMTMADRPNVVLTLVIDISGSMSSNYAEQREDGFTTLLDVTKYGLASMQASLKEGDIINIVTFESTSAIVAEGLSYNDSTYQQHITNLRSRGGTNMNLGITTAYEVANRHYDANKSNRIVLLTDAYMNTGEINSELIAQNTLIANHEGIYLAGIGIGDNFNDEALNQITDIGKGVYSAMITPNDAQRIFSDGFMRFIDHAVAEVRFKLDYPDNMTHERSGAEEVSQNPEDVQTINFAFNDEQFFIESFSSDPSPVGTEEFILEIEYEDENGNMATQQISMSINDLKMHGSDQIKSAASVLLLTQLIGAAITCDEVQSSGLYYQEVYTAIFSVYKQYIDTYCQL
ncbi:MAG: VWA domain-containing protein [Pseudomonadales bacterium]|nr:VWA domain-containing protein [Pseudomonadales bacterium]